VKAKQILYGLLALGCCWPAVSSSGALLLGLLFAALLGTPTNVPSNQWGGYLLKASVIGLGFGIDMQTLLEAGRQNVGITTVFVLGVLGAGFVLTKLLRLDRITGLLIAVGTAICGGSAIAAVGSVLRANAQQLSMATGVVFLLNAVALFIFPVLGNALELSEVQFGTWAAIAIHDTSSVVGAAAKYGDVALRVASVTKMLRILWIIPVSLVLVVSIAENRESFRIPMFIVGFVLASCLYSFVPAIEPTAQVLYRVAKQLMVVSLFLIGSSISIASLRQVGVIVIGQAIALWLLVSIAALLYVKMN
jgi:uncharacterized integral membrane protein (TIGR00698 family)